MFKFIQSLGLEVKIRPPSRHVNVPMGNVMLVHELQSLRSKYSGKWSNGRYGNRMQYLEDLPKEFQDLTKSIEAGITVRSKQWHDK